MYSRGLQIFAWACVSATLALIFVGGLVTSNGAGMAVPDWPLSFGSLNPDGWWQNFAVRLEHGHRLLASIIGLLTGILTAWVWRRFWALPIAFLTSVMAVFCGRLFGLEKIVLMHLSIWPAAAAFIAALLVGRKRNPPVRPLRLRMVAVAAFVGVCVQATLGGIRVTEGTATGSGYTGMPLVLAAVHGCVAQAFLCCLVAVAVMTSKSWVSPHVQESGRLVGSSRGMRFVTAGLVGLVYLQLVLGAVVRHSGAGLAIPDFPLAFGGIVPHVHSFWIDVHFAHRVGGFLLGLLVLGIFCQWLFNPGEARFGLIPAALLTLVALQVALGAHIIWLARPPVTTTLHVLNGAVILAVSLVLAMRASEDGRDPKSASIPLSPSGVLLS